MAVVLLILCFGLLGRVTAQSEACVTPDSKLGSCVPLDDCSPLYDLLRNHSRSSEETAFLLQSQCGKITNSPNVCCPPEAPTERPMDLTMFEDYTGIGNRISEEYPPPIPGRCGIQTTQDKIFGGQATGLDQYPWMALLLYRSGGTLVPACGGSLISERYVVTAAHCVAGRILNILGAPVQVRLGEYDTDNDGPDCVAVPGEGEDCNDPVINAPVERILAHPQYDARQDNDIALIRLGRVAPYTDFIRPICLPNFDVNYFTGPAPQLIVAGWGATEPGVRTGRKLHVKVPLVDITTCMARYPRSRFVVTPRQLCAGGEPGRDSCSGDSGGPLMYPIGSQWSLHGVVSYGPTPCAMANVPGVYTRVYSYLNWIRAQMRP